MVGCYCFYVQCTSKTHIFPEKFVFKLSLTVLFKIFNITSRISLWKKLFAFFFKALVIWHLTKFSRCSDGYKFDSDISIFHASKGNYHSNLYILTVYDHSQRYFHHYTFYIDFFFFCGDICLRLCTSFYFQRNTYNTFFAVQFVDQTWTALTKTHSNIWCTFKRNSLLLIISWKKCLSAIEI